MSIEDAKSLAEIIHDMVENVQLKQAGERIQALELDAYKAGMTESADMANKKANLNYAAGNKGFGDVLRSLAAEILLARDTKTTI